MNCDDVGCDVEKDVYYCDADADCDEDYWDDADCDDDDDCDVD
jgi:hypothetical protein